MQVNSTPSRRSVLVASLALGTFALSACGSNSAASTAQSISGEIKGEITFQTWNLKAGFSDYFTKVIKDFEAANPGTTVKWMDQPADNYASKLQSQVTSNSLPDVVNTAPDLAYPLAQAGALLNLTTADPDAAKLYLPGSWDAGRYASPEGAFSYPWYLNTGPNFYNKKLFTEAGLDAENPPASYEEMLSQATTLGKNVNGRFYMWGNVPELSDFGVAGIELMNADATAFTFNTDKAANLIESYKSAFDAKGILPAGLSMKYTGVGEAFMSGQIAMNAGSAYDLQNFEKNAPELAKNLGIGSAFTSISKYVMSVQDLSVSAKSKNLPTAAAFAKFVTNAENQMGFAKVVNIFPSSAGSLDDPFFSKEDGTQNTSLRVASAKQLKTAETFHPVQFTDPMATFVQQQISDAVLGKQSAKEALDNSVSKCNQLMA